jgi:cytochrome b subunit of formate dehydrogenase
VFAFFWTHSLLWFYREYKDRRDGRSEAHVNIAELPPHLRTRHVRRFPWGWRLAHLVFAISVMTLVLTGMAVFYAETRWAKAIMAALGGPWLAATIHRIAAVTMLSIFGIHLAVVLARIWRQRRTFSFFGPTSLVPTWKDLEDAKGMLRWFFGQGPRPKFDRWTYWEKFDYWAVFWGMAIIGGSGFMLWFPAQVATVLPGWVFNVATLIHGEEAFLAAVFLFTVHFFNNHFRPDKLPPPDIVMFTGTVPLEEFKREHALEYERLVQSGELEKHLVDKPTPQMTIGSRILGLVLIAFGLTLLALVLIGFIRSVRMA